MRLTLSKGDIFCRRGDAKVFIIDKSDENNPWKFLKEIAGGSGKDEKYVFTPPTTKTGKVSKKSYLRTQDFCYHLQCAATQLGYKSHYTGHSLRNALVPTLTLAGASDEMLRIFCTWSGSSEMPHIYKRHTLEASEKGCAELVNKIVRSKEIYNLQRKLNY